MKAKLVSGDVVDLPKECDCSHHNEPHWLHMDRVWRSMNRRYFLGMFPAMGGIPEFDHRRKMEKEAKLSTLAFAREEQQRLQEKLYEMRARHIVKLLR